MKNQVVNRDTVLVLESLGDCYLVVITPSNP